MSATSRPSRGPEDATGEHPRRRFDLLRATIGRANDAGFTDLAGYLAYYAALSIFPTIAVLVALLGLLGDQGTARTLIHAFEAIAPASAVHALRGPIHGLVSSHGEAGVAAVLALLLAFWASSGYVGGFIRAANAIHGVAEERPMVRLRAVQLGLTLACVGIVALMLIALALSGPVLDSAAGAVGLGSTATTIFNVARWPLLALAGAAAIAILARYAPDLDPRPWSAVLRGTALSLGIWILASAAFGIYVATLGSYEATYASLAGAIVFLVWLWISNIALLVGVALNAELALRRGDHARADRGPAVEPRSRGTAGTASERTA
jgi:membrane protein